MIQVDGLSKYYASHKAIDGISFRIGEGEIVGLLGLNGAGKSTILKVLGCFLVPSGGNATVGGHRVTDDPHEVRKLIGYLPDHPPLYDEMTVGRYLSFVAKLKNVPTADVDRSVADAMAKTNTSGVADARLGALSHGFRQRVGIAQAMVHRPRVLILDEPINGLDPIQIVEMRDTILALRKLHTVILSSHILSEITKTCDRILVIDKGKLIAEGTETELAGGGSKTTRIEVQFTGAEGAVASGVKALSGVASVEIKNVPNATRLIVEATGEARSAIAKAVIAAGGDLLVLRKMDDGLENLFLKLVQNSNSYKSES